MPDYKHSLVILRAKFKTQVGTGNRGFFSSPKPLGGKDTNIRDKNGLKFIGERERFYTC